MFFSFTSNFFVNVKFHSAWESVIGNNNKMSVAAVKHVSSRFDKSLSIRGVNRSTLLGLKNEDIHPTCFSCSLANYTWSEQHFCAISLVEFLSKRRVSKRLCIETTCIEATDFRDTAPLTIKKQTNNLAIVPQSQFPSLTLLSLSGNKFAMKISKKQLKASVLVIWEV